MYRQVAVLAGLVFLVSCGTRPAPDSASAAAPPKTVPQSSLLGTRPAQVTVPAGARVRVRLAETLSTQRTQTGDKFTATLDEPIVHGDKVVVPKGTPFQGHVTSAADSGRLKGRAELGLTLDSFELRGVTYPIDTSSSSRTSGSHKKRNMLLIGGGSGLGAALGAVAGGPAGALIGAGAGAGAGTAGAAATGKMHVSLPAETALTFTLEEPFTIPS
jgi:hypothetical protein